MMRELQSGWCRGALLVVLCVPLAAEASLWERLGLRKRAATSGAPTDSELVSGLKEALQRGVRQAVDRLGREDGFLSDAQVKIPLPDGLQRMEGVLRTLGQGHLADEFTVALNRAAEAAVPEAAAILGDAVSRMTLADARDIVTSTNTAATDYFRRTSFDELEARFLPRVREATEKAGVTSAYKRALDRAGLGAGGGGGLLGGLGRSLLGTENLDLDAYVTRKSLDGLFVKIAEEERRIRDDPAARTSALLERVFGQVWR